MQKDIDDFNILYRKIEFSDNIENRNTLKLFMEKNIKNDNFSYILWSVTQSASMVHSYIKDNYLKGELVAVIDRAKTGYLEGCLISKKEQILKYRESIIFVCSDAAIEEAKIFLKKIKYIIIFSYVKMV